MTNEHMVGNERDHTHTQFIIISYAVENNENLSMFVSVCNEMKLKQMLFGVIREAILLLFFDRLQKVFFKPFFRLFVVWTVDVFLRIYPNDQLGSEKWGHEKDRTTNS